LYLLLVALADSNAWHLINYLGAAALNATEGIVPIIGIQLAEEQWKAEVKNILAASLAGSHIRAFDYARGTYAGRPSVIDRTPPHLEDPSRSVRVAVEISSLFKFRDVSFKDVSAVGFWGSIILCILIFLGSRRFSTAENRQTLKDEGGDYHYHDSLWATIFFKIVWKLLKSLWKQVQRLGIFLWRKADLVRRRASPPVSRPQSSYSVTAAGETQPDRSQNPQTETVTPPASGDESV
jgi:hypothetical protein